MLTWLKKEPRGWKKLVFLAGLILFVDYCLALLALGYFGRSPPSPVIYALRILRYSGDKTQIFWNLLVWVIFEEVLFRAIPIALAFRLKRIWVVLGVAAASSIAFGFVAPQHAFVSFQTKCWIAVGGMLLSLLYIKCGGLRRDISVKALLFCVYAHFMVDALYLGMFTYMAHKPT
jgi:hypothetical protein